jgi:hypothetical protein
MLLNYVAEKDKKMIILGNSKSRYFVEDPMMVKCDGG